MTDTVVQRLETAFASRLQLLETQQHAIDSKLEMLFDRLFPATSPLEQRVSTSQDNAAYELCRQSEQLVDAIAADRDKRDKTMRDQALGLQTISIDVSSLRASHDLLTAQVEKITADWKHSRAVSAALSALKVRVICR